ncbi:MAG TPA: UPF0182 family protein [Terriglobia bacterium]|nr:UPF0182 family protein [Terriglobia bacterium]
MKQNRLARLVLAAVLLLLVVGPLLSGGVDLLVDWLWFGEEGFRAIYTTLLKAQIGLSGLASFGFMAVLAANLLIARSIAHRRGYRVYSEVIEFPALERFTSLFRALVWVAVIFLGYIVGEWSSGHGFDYLLARNAVTLHQADPLFGIDLGFYLFQLPFYWFLFYLALVTLILSLLGVAFLYFIEGGVYVVGRGVTITRAARAHFMILGAALFFLLAFRARLAMYDLLYSSRGLIYGAGYTDVHATLPVLWILLGLCLLTGLAFLAGAQSGSLRPPGFAILALVGVWVIGGAIYPEIVQRLIVAPNESDKEKPYIARAIEFTRKAYALDRFTEREFSAVEDLTLDNIHQNDATMRNVRLWDHKPLLTTFSQLQEIRTYYDFPRVDNDRYWINSTYRQVSLSPRELNPASLPSRNWINEHLTYTHGYGLCMGPVNESTPDGLPVFLVKDIPPVSDDPAIHITRPEIYYGELPNDYCFVNTRLKEFDYPSGDQNVYTSYAGAGGIPVRNFARRLLFALKFGEPKILLSTDIRPESRLMIYRSILDRAGRLTPFLTYDHDPYMVIAQDGSLYWMLDGYTASSQYPYSEPWGDGQGNYIRNSVKATINAYTGETRFYISDPSDPLIQAYDRIFPGVFQPLSAMPADLRAHIRYPEDFFSIQAAKYAVYHMTDPRVFYNKEDLWRVAQSAARGSEAPMSPYYTIMKLAEVGKTEEFILMVPFTPARKDNMIAWMAARCDAPDYGKVLVFTFPKQKLVYGPQQIESRIDQDPGISQQLTLWDQGGSKVIRGTLLVIPVLNSVLYVEPLYLAAETGGGLPQLKRVIVSYSDHVVMESSFDAALSRVFGGTVNTAANQPATAAGTQGQASGGQAVSGQPQDLQQMIQEANQHFERAQQLLRQGDWAGYGEEVKKLGEALKNMSVPGKPR